MGGQLESGYPAVGAIYQDGKFNCTGTLISERMVLTAKHCTNASAASLEFWTGTNPGNGVSHAVAEILQYPVDGDVALLRLSSPIMDVPFEHVASKALPRYGDLCTVVGMGDHQNSDGSTTAGTKYSGTVTVTNFDDSLTPAGTFGISWGSALPAPGDSGAALLCNRSIAGIVRSRDTSNPSMVFVQMLNNQWIVGHASNYSSEPVFSASSRAGGRIDLLARGVYGDLIYKYYSGTQWYPLRPSDPFDSLGGILVGQPEVVTRDGWALDIFVRGTDLHVYYKAVNSAGWWPDRYGYYHLGGPVGSHVSALWRGPDRLDLFATGTTGGILHKKWTSSGGWSPAQDAPWELVGAGEVTNITVVSSKPERLDLFAGDGYGVVHKALEGDTWTPAGLGYYDQIGGGIRGNISATSWGPDRIDLAAQGINRNVLHKWYDHGSWGPSMTGWEDHGGIINGPPKIVSRWPNDLQIFVQGSTGALHNQGWSPSTQWVPSLTQWGYVPGNMMGGPLVVTWAGAQKINVFVMDVPYMGVRQQQWEGDWRPSWTMIGGELSW
jgi:hypothetical protein